MPCYDFPIPTGDGSTATAIVCIRGSGGRRRRCVGCKRFVADRLCDIPVPGRNRDGTPKTCSAPVCSSCSVRLGDDDVCPAHAIPAEALRCAAAPIGRRR